MEAGDEEGPGYPGSAVGDPAGADETTRSDADLLGAIRGRPGDAASAAAFGTLYDRHRDAARALARQLARSPSDADDLVSAAFARLLEILRAGGGPTEAFRAYLLTSLRHLAYDRTRADRRLDLTEDMGDVIGVDPTRTVIPFTDPAVAGFERSVAARAFATLPERWQAVLWHLEVEGDSPADIAPLFGLTPNAVSALGYRAREGLRQAYLQEHLASERADAPPRDKRHRDAEERLGAYTRGGLSKRDAVKVEEHLRECAECRALAAELREVNSGIVRSAIGPLVLGAALVGYLAERANPGGLFLSGAWPSTAELMVAGGGVLGVIGAVGELVRTPTTTRGRRLGAAAVGLAGIGVATATVLGAPPVAPPPPAPLAVPGPTLLPPGPLPPPDADRLPGAETGPDDDTGALARGTVGDTGDDDIDEDIDEDIDDDEGRGGAVPSAGSSGGSSTVEGDDHDDHDDDRFDGAGDHGDCAHSGDPDDCGDDDHGGDRDDHRGRAGGDDEPDSATDTDTDADTDTDTVTLSAVPDPDADTVTLPTVDPGTAATRSGPGDRESSSTRSAAGPVRCAVLVPLRILGRGGDLGTGPRCAPVPVEPVLDVLLREPGAPADGRRAG